ncbi:DUF1656 domain-containing protein [Hyphomicrobium sp.]|jgi:hypothetical protein|uniref:DUF1656 domain-containing protein n=1 Tax=Hyphomicrobium sp. TaxID=82 RepID=UPI003562E6C3
MNEEISIFGIFVPSILACSIISYILMVAASRVLRAAGAYQYIWHRSLFNLSIFVCLLGATVLLFSQAHP